MMAGPFERQVESLVEGQRERNNITLAVSMLVDHDMPTRNDIIYEAQQLLLEKFPERLSRFVQVADVRIVEGGVNRDGVLL